MMIFVAEFKSFAAKNIYNKNKSQGNALTF